MTLKFINSKNKKKIVSQLNEQFGIEDIPYLLLETGKQKIRGFSGSMVREELQELSEIVNVEIVGIYLMKKETDNLRLSLDGVHVFQEQISKNVIQLNEKQFKEWIKARNVKLSETGKSANKFERGFYVVKYKDDFIGCGYFKEGVLINFVPRERSFRS